MHLIVLCGLPGVGKLSIARELAGRTRYRVFHNHLVVDLVEALFEFGSKPFVELREHFWLSALSRAADEKLSGVVFTLAFDRTVSPSFPEKLDAMCRARNSRSSFVELICEASELERRLLAPERARFGKLVSLDRYRELASTGAFERLPLPSNTVRLDTSRLSVGESAERIFSVTRAQEYVA